MGRGAQRKYHPQDRILQHKIKITFQQPQGATQAELEENLNQAKNRVERELREIYKAASTKNQIASAKYGIYKLKNT